MKKMIGLFALIWCVQLQAQAPYFQQQADYRIDVRLDDQAHILHGHLNLIYHNNAPEALDTLYFHLWP
ncbi:MAG: M1 family peptidase, partial [bacterium]|nr:M1 family peptidase [bacterium]